MMRAVALLALYLLLPIGRLRRGRSDVADAVDARATRRPCATLLEQHADVNAPQADGATALHWAVYRGPIKRWSELLIQRRRERRRLANREGATPLWLASINGDAAMIDALLEGRSRSEREACRWAGLL